MQMGVIPLRAVIRPGGVSSNANVLDAACLTLGPGKRRDSCCRLLQCKQGRHSQTHCSSNQGFSGETGRKQSKATKRKNLMVNWDDIPSEHREVLLQQHRAGSIVTMDGGSVGSSITGATTSPTCARLDIVMEVSLSIRTLLSSQAISPSRLFPSPFTALWPISLFKLGPLSKRRIAPTSVASWILGRLLAQPTYIIWKLSFTSNPTSPNESTYQPITLLSFYPASSLLPMTHLSRLNSQQALRSTSTILPKTEVLCPSMSPLAQMLL